MHVTGKGRKEEKWEGRMIGMKEREGRGGKVGPQELTEMTPLHF